MVSLRMLLSAVSLSIIMLSWPQAGSGAPKSCAELVKEFYQRVDLYFLMGKDKTQEFIKENLPAIKAACPEEAKSMTNLENGDYLRKLEAKRKKDKKSHGHVKTSGDSPNTGGKEDDLEGLLEVLR